MNREILFKAKRKDNSEWVEGYIYELQPCQYMICNEKEYGRSSTLSVLSFFEYCSHEIDPDTICQYTGLTDKNGRKIWENDILRRDGYWDIRIEFENGAFMVRNADKVQYINRVACTPISTFDIKAYEVIGNIFDNAELLEVKR